MKHIILLSIMLFIGVSSFAQQEQAQPDEHTTVTKEYDKDGNLIRYDSTYTRSWSSSSNISNEEIEEMQKQVTEAFNDMGLDEVFESIRDSTIGFIESGQADSIANQFGVNLQDFMEEHDSIIYTYPLDSTMMEPIKGMMSPENMEQMQKVFEQQMQEFFGE